MKNLAKAISFLTIIPTGKRTMKDDDKVSDIIVRFPMVGAILALFAIIPMLIDNYVISSSPTNWAFQIMLGLICVGIVAFLTRGLHLDGLADTFDAIGGNQNKEKSLTIMKDSNIGAFGVIILIITLLIKASAIASVPSFSFKVCGIVLALVLSRWGLVINLFFAKPAKKEGLGNIFFDQLSTNNFKVASIIPIALAMFIGYQAGVILFVSIFIFVFLWNKRINKTLGGQTGDTCGAITELIETYFLLCWTVVYNSNIMQEIPLLNLIKNLILKGFPQWQY